MEHDSFFRKITEQVSAQQPLVEITGRNRILIEHHQGIFCCSEQEITIKMPYGRLRITGEALSVLIATSEQLLIAGTVIALMLSGG